MSGRPVPVDPGSRELGELQTQIDALDVDLIALLVRRYARSRRIGELKRSVNAPLVDPVRIAEQKRRFVERCASEGLDPGMAARLIGVVIDQVVAERVAAAVEQGTA